MQNRRQTSTPTSCRNMKCLIKGLRANELNYEKAYKFMRFLMELQEEKFAKEIKFDTCLYGHKETVHFGMTFQCPGVS